MNLLLLIAACLAQDDEKIRIVSSLPRTGAAKAQTDSIVLGFRLAFEEAEWKAGKFKIEYDDLDDSTAAAGQWTAKAEMQNAERAIKNKDVMVYLGTFNSGAARVSMPMLNRHHLLMISPANTWPGLTKKMDSDEPDVYRPSGKINYVRVVPSDDVQAILGAEWARELKVKKVYVFHDGEVYGTTLAQNFRKRCQELGIDVVGFELVKKLDPKDLASKTPDLVYFGGTTMTVNPSLFQHLATPLMVSDGCFEDAFLELAGKEKLEGRCYVTFGGIPPPEEFAKKFEVKWGRKPEVYAVYGYEAARVALEAIRRAGVKDRDAIRRACLEIREFRSELGVFGFDENGDTTHAVMSGYVVRNGAFEFERRLEGKPSTKSDK
jgi:branched-chain amino acid transport system substrate-binding protein